MPNRPSHHPTHAGRHPYAPPAAPAPLTPEQLAEQRRRATERNLNGLLYIAGFLAIGAAAAFVAGALPPVAKLAGVWLVAAVFYGAGLALAQAVERLRPAGVAFTWTGLAILPFGGAALDAYTSLPSAAAWLLTSLTALAALTLATLLLRQTALAHLAVLAVVSTAIAGVSAVGLPMLWMFLAVVVVAVAASVSARHLPRSAVGLVRQPLDISTWALSPLAVLASFPTLPLPQIALVAGAAAAQYALAWIIDRHDLRVPAARVLLELTLLLLVGDLVRAPYASLLVALVGLTQVALSTWRLTRLGADRKGLRDVELALLGLGLTTVAAALLFGMPSRATLYPLVITVALALAAAGSAWVLRSLPLGIAAAVAWLSIPFASPFLPPAAWWPDGYLALTLGLLLLALLTIRRPEVGGWGALAAATATVHLLAVTAGVPNGADGVRIAALALAAAGLVAVSRLAKVPALAVLALVPTSSALGILSHRHAPETWQTTLPALGILALVVAWQAYDIWRPSRLPLTIALAAASVLATGWLLVAGWDGRVDSVAPMVLAGVALLMAATLWVSRRDRAVTGIILTGLIVVMDLQIIRQAAVDDTAYLVPFGILATAGWILATGVVRPVRVEGPAILAAVSQILAATVFEGALPSVAYAHGVAALLALTVWRRTPTRVHAVAVLAVPTVVTGLTAVTDGGAYAMVFLVQQVVIAVAGALLSKRWALWWGLTTSTLAVVYFLRDYLFLELALLSAVLIAIVVWRLLRRDGRAQAEERPAPVPSPQQPASGPQELTRVG